MSESPFMTMASAAKKYLININGEIKGPYVHAELQKLYRNKHVGPFDQVREHESEEWIDLLKVIEIDDSPQQAPQVVHQQHIINNPVSDNTLAAIINVFVPGVGQMIQERVGLGIGFLFGTIIGYVLFIIPGIIVHVICIINAANYKPPRKL